MFMFSRLNLLFSCLILLKIVIAVTKGIYLIVLKVCNEIGLTLTCDEDSHFSQNERQSEMDSYNTSLLSTRSPTSNIVNRDNHQPSVDFLIYNLPIGKKITVRHLKNYEVVTESSEITCDKPNNFRQGMIVQETSHPVGFEPHIAFDGEIPRTSFDCSTPLNNVYITSQDKSKGTGSFSESLRSSEQPSSTKVFVKCSDERSYLQMQIFDENIKSHLNKSNHTKKKISEFGYLNVPAQFVEERHKLHAFPSRAITPCPSVETFSLNNSDESVYREENKMIQSNETQYLKDKEHNSDSYIVKSNGFNSNYTITDQTLDESEMGWQNDENNYKKTEDSGDFVAETNNEEVYLSYPKDYGRFTACSQDETKGSSFSFWKDLKTLEFQGKEVHLETSKASNIEGSGEGSLNHSKAGYLDKCNTECSDGPIKEKIYDNSCGTETVQVTKKAPDNREIFTAEALMSMFAGRNENVQDTEMVLENTKHGANLAAKALLSTSVNGTTETVRDTDTALTSMEHGENHKAQASLSTVPYIKINESTPSSTHIPGASNEIRKYDRAAYLEDLAEMKPVIYALENAMLSWCERTVGIRRSKIKTDELEVVCCSFNFLRVRSMLMKNTPYYECVSTYVEEIKSIFSQINDESLCPSPNGNDQKGPSYVTDIRRKLVKKRKFLLRDSEELNKIFTEGKEIQKTRISRKSKSKNKRRRR